MSQPILSGENLAVDTSGGILRVTNDPGFTSDNGDGCPYRAVWLRTAPGTDMFGREVPRTTQPETRWAGFFETRGALAAWTLALPQGNYRLAVYGGTLFTPWVPGQEGPFIEWGSTDQGKNPSGVPRVNQIEFTVALPPPPPPLPPDRWTLQSNELAMTAIGYQLVEQWRTNGVSDPEINGTLHYNALKALQSTGAKRAAYRDALKKVSG